MKNSKSSMPGSLGWVNIPLRREWVHRSARSHWLGWLRTLVVSRNTDSQATVLAI